MNPLLHSPILAAASAISCLGLVYSAYSQSDLVWLSMPVSGKSWGTNLPPEARTFPADAQQSKLAWKEIVHAIHIRYPNVKIIYSSTKGAMYMTATATKNPEFIGVLLHQMTTDPTATPWFLKPGAPSNQPLRIVKEASADPNPVSAGTTALSVLGADDGGESNPTYTWSCTDQRV